MGCPAKRVVAGACGSALMREPELAQELVRAVRARGAGATCRSRSSTAPAGTSATCNAPEFACAMVEAGAAMITVHGRTRTQGFSGKRDRAHHPARCAPRCRAHVPVVGNGDVVDVDDYLRMREETGCDAVMIGRGALGNPWLFRGIRERLRGRPDPGAPTLAERLARVSPPRRSDRAAHAAKALVHELRKAVAWYTKGLRDSSHVRERAFNIMDPMQVREIAIAYFSSLDQEKSAPREIVSLVDKFGRQVA